MTPLVTIGSMICKIDGDRPRVNHSILFVPELSYTQWRKFLLCFKPIILAPEAQKKYKKLDAIVLENKYPAKKVTLPPVIP